MQSTTATKQKWGQTSADRITLKNHILCLVFVRAIPRTLLPYLAIVSTNTLRLPSLKPPVLDDNCRSFVADARSFASDVFRRRSPPIRCRRLSVSQLSLMPLKQRATSSSFD